MSSAIQCRDLRKTYDGKVEAVRGLNLEIQNGECFGLLGPNGAGKTTTIEILEGLLSATSGEVTIFGRTWQKDECELREWMGISLQETRLSEKLTVRETLELFASFYRSPRSSSEVLEALQLTEKADSWVGKLSGGQRQRLAVATALVGDPKILSSARATTHPNAAQFGNRSPFDYSSQGAIGSVAQRYSRRRWTWSSNRQPRTFFFSRNAPAQTAETILILPCGRGFLLCYASTPPPIN